MLWPASAQRPDFMRESAHEVVWTRRGARLLRYRAESRASARVPLLIVPSMINRHYVVDLLPGRSLVEHLLGQGVDVWLIDWGGARPHDRHLEFDDCIEALLGAAVERVVWHSGSTRVALLGYCMGATMAAIYSALHNDRLAALINLAGPIDFSQAGVLGTWADARWFDPQAIIDSVGNLPGWLMQTSFLWLVPTASLHKLLAVIDRGDDEAFLRGFFALETWANDNVSFPGAAYVKYIRELYQQNRLHAGTLTVHGRPARLEAIDCPTLTITADRDHICPAPCALALNARVGSRDTQSITLPGGHVGVVVGSGAQKHLWPALDAWLLPRLAGPAAKE